jgi:hypothetical protein
MESVHVISKEEKLAGRFVGRKTAAVGKAISAEGKEYGSEEKIILLYTSYDCQSCVVRGFEIIKRIDSLHPARKTYIIASQSKSLNSCRNVSAKSEMSKNPLQNRTWICRSGAVFPQGGKPHLPVVSAGLPLCGNGRNGESAGNSPYCTDQRAESAVDCRPGDAGENEKHCSGF